MPTQSITPQNLLIILSDEHSRKVLGCYGHLQIKTPALDSLARRGTRFSNAYTNSPICVPARAAFATGRFVHQIGCWDNAIAYDGQPQSWGHRLMEQGHCVVSIGKLHYTREDPARNGFTEERLPLHIHGGQGDLLGLIRDELPRRAGARQLGPEAGPGESEYTHYDREVAADAVEWLSKEGRLSSSKPWVLYVGFVAPHFPLIAPQQFFDLYPPESVPMPIQYGEHERPTHPFLAEMRRCMNHDEGFEDEAMVRRAIAAYFGLTSFLDDNVRKVLHALEESGLANSTRVLYASDHGDNLGARGFWGKSTMYEESAGIPLLLSGTDVPQGNTCETAATLIDAYPTIVQAVGAELSSSDADLPGASLFEIARGAQPGRRAFSEYHAVGSTCGMYMLREANLKLVHFACYPPMLFDLARDPDEACDLSHDPRYAADLERLTVRLHEMLDPLAVDQRAKRDQHQRIEAAGGETAIRKQGMFRYSPPPGSQPVMYSDAGAAGRSSNLKEAK